MKALHSLILTAAAGLLATGCVYSHRGGTAVVKEPIIGKTVMAEPARTTIVRQTTQPAIITPSEEIIVTTQPPAPRREVMGIAPDSSHVWVNGYWTYTNNQWVWIPGHWEARPRTGAIWVPGYWQKDPDERRWIWKPGHWE